MKKRATLAGPCWHWNCIGENPGERAEVLLRKEPRGVVAVHDGKMIRESEFKRAGVPAMRFQYQLEIADEEAMFHTCTFLIGRQVVELSVSDKVEDFTPEVLESVDKYFQSFAPLK